MGAGQDWGKVIWADERYIQSPDNNEVVKIFRKKSDNLFYYKVFNGSIFPLIPVIPTVVKTTEVFEVNGFEIELANIPIYVSVFKNGIRLNPTNVGSYNKDYSIISNVITLEVESVGDLFLIENTH